MLSEPEITQWIAADRAALPAASAAYVAYVSLHEVHNAGVSAQRLNVARAAVSKALSSTARWAPKLILGPNKNLHVEPIVWAFEWAQAHHGYSDTTSN